MTPADFDREALRIAKEVNMVHPLGLDLWNQNIPVGEIQKFCTDFAHAIRDLVCPAGSVEPVGYLDGRGRFFYANDPLMLKDHKGMRPVYVAAAEGEKCECAGVEFFLPEFADDLKGEK